MRGTVALRYSAGRALIGQMMSDDCSLAAVVDLANITSHYNSNNALSDKSSRCGVIVPHLWCFRVTYIDHVNIITMPWYPPSPIGFIEPMMVHVVFSPTPYLCLLDAVMSFHMAHRWMRECCCCIKREQDMLQGRNRLEHDPYWPSTTGMCLSHTLALRLDPWSLIRAGSSGWREALIRVVARAL